MPTFIYPKFAPWFEALCAHLDMKGDEFAFARENGGVIVAGTPVFVGVPAVGADDHVLLQAVVGPLPEPPHRTPLLERVLQWQMLVCGPAACMFGFEPSQQNLLLMRTVEPDRLPAADAAMMVRSLALLAVQWVRLLQDPDLLARPDPAFARAGIGEWGRSLQRRSPG